MKKQLKKIRGLHVLSYFNVCPFCGKEIPYGRLTCLGHTLGIEGNYERIFNSSARRVLSEKMVGDRNPMKRPDVVDKVSKTLKTKRDNGWVSPLRGRRNYGASEKMLRDNPMKRPDVRKRQGELQKEMYRNGYVNPNNCNLSITCEVCGKVVHRKPSRISGYKHHYCDKKCRVLGRRGGIPWNKIDSNITCDTCGKVEHRRRVLIAKFKHHYCSIKCFRHIQRK